MNFSNVNLILIKFDSQKTPFTRWRWCLEPKCAKWHLRKRFVIPSQNELFNQPPKWTPKRPQNDPPKRPSKMSSKTTLEKGHFGAFCPNSWYILKSYTADFLAFESIKMYHISITVSALFEGGLQILFIINNIY